MEISAKPTEPAAASARPRQNDRNKSKEAMLSKQGPRTTHQKRPELVHRSSRDETVRLKEICEHQSSQHRELDNLAGSSDLRWNVNKLEKEKLELSAIYNEEVSKYEGQLAKLRAVVERGEAQRQNLEYEIAVVRKDAGKERNAAEEKMAGLFRKNEQLKVYSAELHQRVSDLEKALAITRQARDEDQQALQVELEERDRLLLSANAENDHLCVEKKRLEALLQVLSFKAIEDITGPQEVPLGKERTRVKRALEDQEDTLLELQRKMEQKQSEREGDRENLRKQASELEFIAEREERLKKELEAAQQRVKNLEANVESERAAHLESKFNSEIIQLRIRDLEAALQVEKISQADALSSLELMKQQFREVEKAYEQERDKARDSLEKLIQFEKDYLASKSELSKEFEENRRVVAGLSEKLKNHERLQSDSQQELDTARKRQAFLKEEQQACVRDLEQLLHQCGVSGPWTAGEPGEGARQSPTALLESLRRTVTHYQHTLEKTTTEMQDLRRMHETVTQECKLNEEIICDQKKRIQEAHTGLAHANEEAVQLRARCADSAAVAKRAQSELRAARHHWESERERLVEAEKEIHRLSQVYQKDSEEKLTFLHDLYQRLVAGCVLIKQPQGLLGSFSWPELCAVLREHADALTSDLSRANEKISHLEHVCQKKNAVVLELHQTQENTFSKLAEQVKKREEAWQRQKKDVEQHYSSLSAEVNTRAQKWQKVAEEAQEKVASLEKIRTQMALDLARFQSLLPQCRREGAILLSACTLLAGGLCPLYRQLRAVSRQKAHLLEQVGASKALESEIRSLVEALGPGGTSGERSEVQGKRVFRKCAIAIVAANRFQRFGQRSQILFTTEQGSRGLPALSVCAVGARSAQLCAGTENEPRRSDMACEWVRSRDFLALVLSTMGNLQDLAFDPETRSQHPGPRLLTAARRCFTKLVEQLMAETEGSLGAWCGEWGELVSRLGQGLHKLNAQADQRDRLTALTGKRVVAVLQQRILEFTQRLHTAEVERRSLRLELARVKRGAQEVKREAQRAAGLQHTGGVPLERFESVCQELSDAIQREQQAQALLHEQALQLQELGLRLEVHSGEEAEKDQTLVEAVKSLSEAKMELRRKDQSLRQLGKRLSQLQQDKRQLEENVQHAESALRTAAKAKDSVAGYMRSIEEYLKDVKERISLSQAAATRDDFTLQLPRVHLDPTGAGRMTGGPEATPFQSFISCFMEVYQMACSRMAGLEKEISSHQTHIAALKSELQDACLRESQCYAPVSGIPTCLPEKAEDFTALQQEMDLSLRESAGNGHCRNPSSARTEPPKTSRGHRKCMKKASLSHRKAL